ncbi:MAG: polyhydroxyalkanoic acid system family protein [Actinomycetota bacterium]
MAKAFYVSAPHSLPVPVARRRIELLLSETQAMLADPKVDEDPSWEDNERRFRLKLGMFPLSGTVKVDSSTVEVRGKLPWGLRRYSARVERVVAERLKALLANGGPPPSEPTVGPPFRIV